MLEREVIRLSERGEPARLSQHRLSRDDAQRLTRDYHDRLTLRSVWQEPEQPWELRALDSVGYVPLSQGLGVHIAPKVEIGNVFRMLEWAHGKPLEVLRPEISCSSLEEYYEQLAKILAERVYERGRKGLYRDYVRREEELAYVRGRMDMRRAVQRPWRVKPHCRYEEHTPDLEENQILAWTLRLVSRHAFADPKARRSVQSAYRLIQGSCGLRPFVPDDCVDRLYNRLNADYRPLHFLCRFFLEHTGPTHRLDDHSMLAFLIDMPALYEQFVAAWLDSNMPGGWKVEAQRTRTMGAAEELHLRPDLVLRERTTGTVSCVLDCKYKEHEKVSEPDVYQVVAYAEALGCSDGYLIYPKPLATPLDARFQHVRVRSLTFGLDGDLDACGERFLRELRLTESAVPLGAA